MDELADQIRAAVVAVTDIDIQVEPRMVMSPSPPSIDIYPAPDSRDTTSAGYGDLDGAYMLTVRARVDPSDHDAGQDVLLAFMDDEDDLCIAAAIEDDPTLNGLAASVDVVSTSGFGSFADGAYVGCQWTVRIINATS